MYNEFLDFIVQGNQVNKVMSRNIAVVLFSVMVYQILLKSPLKYEFSAAILACLCYFYYRQKKKLAKIDEQGIWQLGKIIPWSTIREIQFSWGNTIVETDDGNTYFMRIEGKELLARGELNVLLFYTRKDFVFLRKSDFLGIQINIEKGLINPYQLALNLGLSALLTIFAIVVGENIFLNLLTLKSTLLEFVALMTFFWLMIPSIIDDIIYLWGIFSCHQKVSSNNLAFQLTEQGLDYQIDNSQKHIDWSNLKSLTAIANHATVLRTKSGEKIFVPFFTDAMRQQLITATGFRTTLRTMVFSKLSM